MRGITGSDRMTWLVLAGVLATFGLTVSLVDFQGPVALTIHFLRITGTIAAVIIYVQLVPSIFRGKYSPAVTDIFVAINFFVLSLVCFSFWNEAGRIFGVDTSVFTSPVAGLFSLFAVIAVAFAIAAPDTGGSRPKLLALIIGAILSVGLVFIAPLFR